MQRKMESICDTYVEEDHFSGVVLVKMGEEILFERAYGLANKDWNIPNHVLTKFDTASITKLFTAVSILQLVDKGFIHVHDKIHDILDLEDTSIHEQITVHHLLTHTSGMGDDADEEAGEVYEELWQEKPNYTVRDTIDYLPQFIYKQPNFQPGERHRYNNCAYILLGLVIEKVSGQGYREYVEQSIFNKIGMFHTGFYAMDEVTEEAAEHYASIKNEYDEVIGLRKNIYTYPVIGSADAGALSTVKDLDIFIRSLKNGELLSRKWTEAILRPQEVIERHTFVTEKVGYGFECVVDNNTGKVIYVQKDGMNPGVASIVSYYPEQDMTIIILANQDTNVWDLAWDIQELYIGEI